MPYQSMTYVKYMVLGVTRKQEVGQEEQKRERGINKAVGIIKALAAQCVTAF